MSPAQDEQIRRSRADSGPATQTRSTGSRPGVMDAGPRWHSVRQGETFATIAQIYYGSGHVEQHLVGQSQSGREAR